MSPRRSPSPESPPSSPPEDNIPDDDSPPQSPPEDGANSPPEEDTDSPPNSPPDTRQADYESYKKDSRNVGPARQEYERLRDQRRRHEDDTDLDVAGRLALFDDEADARDEYGASHHK
jgi:hypothetical protein